MVSICCVDLLVSVIWVFFLVWVRYLVVSLLMKLVVLYNMMLNLCGVVVMGLMLFWGV